MEGFTTLFSAFGLASAAGFNAYVPLLAVGLTARYTELLSLAEPFDLLTNPWVLAVIGVIALVDFIADKIPAFDSLWHTLGIAVAPVAGAILFASQHNVLTDVHPLLAALCGLVVAGGFHGGRAAARPISTAATGGAMNPVMSGLEDFLSAGLAFLALFLPGMAIALVLALMAALGLVAFKALKQLGRERRSRRANDSA